MKKLLLLIMAIVLCSGLTACKKNPISIADNILKKSLPDVAYNSVDDNFFVFWAAAPDNESTTYYISGQKISSTGRKIGKPVDVLATENTAAMPRVLYNPHKNQYLVIYGVMLGSMNIHGVILDADGQAVGESFKVTDVSASQFHYTMAFNSTKNQFLITYNDSRNGAGDVFGVIFDETGAKVKDEFVISHAAGHQVNPVACYNPHDGTYLVNWEDFRQYGDGLGAYGTLDVMTNIYGALLDDNGSVLVNDIKMCVDDNTTNKDQRFNGIAYNSKNNQFLVSWTDTRPSLQNVGIVGRVVNADGSMPAGDFTLVDTAGGQMISHTMYLPQDDTYFVAFERDFNDVDDFYFKDLNAQLDIGAMWLDANGQPDGSIIDIYTGEHDQRFVRFAHNPKKDNFLLVWQSDFKKADSAAGHIMSAGGNISGALYKKK